MARQQPPEEEPDPYSYIDLQRARLCLDCEMIFDGPQCPACTSETFVPITRWIRPTDRKVIERHPSPAPRIAPPPARLSTPKQILKKSLYLGLGAYGMWKMLFEPRRARNKKPSQIEKS